MTRIWTLAALLLLSPLFQSGHQVVSAQEEAEPLSVVAGGLVNPRGFAFTSAGQLLVAESGTGGEQGAGVEVAGPTGPFMGGATGAVSRIENGCPAPLATALASARTAAGDTLGPSSVVVIGDQIYVLVSGGGAGHGNPDYPAGIYNVTSGTPELLADLSTWLRENPVAEPPAQMSDPDGAWYSMATDETGSALWVVETNGEQVVRVDLDGSISRVADLSDRNQAPTAIAIGDDGSIYIGQMTMEPFAAGSASVIRLGADGNPETVWTGLTMVSGLTIDDQGTLYAAEFSGGRDRAPYFVPGTGRIVRQTGPDSLEEVATLLNFPTSISVGPDGALYVAMPAVGADSGTGIILRVDTAAALPLRAENYDLAPPSCGGETAVALIKVSDLGMDPPSITIQAGTSVTWRNTGEFDHAVTSDPSSPLQWDSGPMRPGEEFSLTFDDPGSYPYFDGLFPERRGAIEVVGSG